MTLIRSAALVALSLAVTSCASLNEGLKNVNEGLGKVTGNKTDQPADGSPAEETIHEAVLTYDGGGTRVVTLKVPPRLCAPDEFVNKFEREYASTWNSRMNTKLIKYDISRDKADKEKATALRAKMLKLPKALPMPSPEEMKRRNRLEANCDNLSTGEVPALHQASNDFQAEYDQ